MKALTWLGDSKKNIGKWPTGVRDQAVYQLQRLLDGRDPTDWKPMKTVGKGVREIRIRGRGDQYRVIYIARFKGTIYVLHAFQKKSQKTARRDLELARRRLNGIHDNGE